MSDAAPVAPIAPAAPAQAAQPTQQNPQQQAPKQHHSAAQPRTDVGTFDKKPAAPQFIELDGKRLSPDEVRAAIAERQEDERANRAASEELQRLRQESQRWQRPHEALTPEQRREIVKQELLEFQRQQEEAKLPPEQQEILRAKRALDRERAEWQRQQEEQKHKEQNALVAQQRQQAANNVQAALKLLGTDDMDAFALRLVVDEFWAASERGKQYTPEVVARRVQRQMDAMTSQRAVKMGPKALLGNADFVAALNSLDDADLLKALAPLGERLRALNLQSRGISAPTPPQPSNVVPLPAGQTPRTDAEWIQHFRANGPPDASNPAAHQRYWRLKDMGVL